MQINRYTREVITQRAVESTADANAVSNAGGLASTAADITGKIANKMQETSEATWLNETLIKKQKQALDMSYSERLSFTDNPYGFSDFFNKKLSEIDNEYVKAAPSPRAAEVYKAQSLQDNLSLYEKNKAWEFDARVSQFDRRTKSSAEDLGNMSYTMGANGDDFDAEILNQVDAVTVAGKDLYSPEQLAMLNDDYRQKVRDQYVQGLSKHDPKRAKEVLKGYSAIPDNADFEYAVNSVFDFEGGYVANDGGKGPTMYGVNSEANPEAFKKIMELENAGDSAGAKEIAKTTYKAEYWDKVGAGSLDPKMAFAAMDSAVNMGVGATKEMLAKADGDVYKFLDMRRAKYQSIAENNPDKQKFLKGWLARVDEMEDRISGGVLPQERIDELSEKADVEIRKKQAEFRVSFKGEMDKVDKAIKAGVKVPDVQLETMASKALENGLTEEYEEIKTVQKTQKDVAEFVKKPILEQTSEIEAQRKIIQGGDLSNVDKYEAISKAYEAKIEAINKNPWDYYSATEIIDAPNTLEMGNSESMNIEISKRRASLALVKEKDGVDLPILTDQEIDALKENYTSGKTENISQVISSLGSVLSTDEKRQVASKFKDSSIVSAAMVQDDVMVANKIIAGSKIEKSAITADAISKEINAKLANAVYSPETLNVFQDAVYAYYKNESLLAGDLANETIDENRFVNAISAVIGDVSEVSIKGSKSNIILPKGITDNQFEDIFDSMDDLSLTQVAQSAPFASDGEPINASDLFSEGVLVSVGDGKYSVILEGLGTVLDKNGKIYEIDVYKAQDYLKKNQKLKVKKELGMGRLYN